MSKRKGFLLILVALVVLYACMDDKGSSDDDVSVKNTVTDTSGYYMYVVPDGLNVRKNPDVDSSIVTVLYQNDRIKTDKVSHSGWYKVETSDDKTGYVNATYLADKPLSEKEIAAQKAAAAAEAQKAEIKTAPATRSKNPDTVVNTPPAESTQTGSSRPTLSKVPKN